MASGPRYNVPMRRRREGVTDYHQRLRLLKSGKPRLVVRVSNHHVRVQLATLSPDGDETVASAYSKELGGFGWEASTSNTPAAYLTGFLAGRRAVAAGLDEAVLDIGLNTASPGSKVFAAQQGAIDAGLEIPHNASVFPDWERVRGEPIAAYAADHPDEFGDGFDVTDLPEHFDEVLEAIEGADL